MAGPFQQKPDGRLHGNVIVHDQDSRQANLSDSRLESIQQLVAIVCRIFTSAQALPAVRSADLDDRECLSRTVQADANRKHGRDRYFRRGNRAGCRDVEQIGRYLARRASALPQGRRRRLPRVISVGAARCSVPCRTRQRAREENRARRPRIREIPDPGEWMRARDHPGEPVAGRLVMAVAQEWDARSWSAGRVELSAKPVITSRSLMGIASFDPSYEVVPT